MIQILSGPGTSLTGLENMLRLLCRVFSAEGVPESVLEDLVFQVSDLSLLMPISGAFYTRAKRTVVLVSRSNRHVVEAAVRDARHANLIHSVVCSAAMMSRCILHILARVMLTLVRLRHCVVLFNAGVRLNALFATDWCTTATVAPLVIARLLQLLALLEVAELVAVRDQEVPSAVLIIDRRLRLMMMLVLKAGCIAQSLSFLCKLSTELVLVNPLVS